MLDLEQGWRAFSMHLRVFECICLDINKLWLHLIEQWQRDRARHPLGEPGNVDLLLLSAYLIDRVGVSSSIDYADSLRCSRWELVVYVHRYPLSF